MSAADAEGSVMNVLLKIGLLAFLCLAVMQPRAFAQSPPAVPALKCEDSHKILAPKNPRRGADGNILSGQVSVQTRLALDENTTVKVVEYPRTGKVLDSYNSTIVVERLQDIQKYSLKKMIKDGDVLRLVELAKVCTSADQGSMFLAFESGATGATEGFAVVRYSAQAIDVQALPLAYQGRIVVKASPSDEIELWSAAQGEGIECDACAKRYSVRDCKLGQSSVTCSKRPGTVGPFSPDKFMRARIEVP